MDGNVAGSQRITNGGLLITLRRGGISAGVRIAEDADGGHAAEESPDDAQGQTPPEDGFRRQFRACCREVCASARDNRTPPSVIAKFDASRIGVQATGLRLARAP
jgi:hypothetical protein